jgi:hypothetical protein
MQCTLSPSARKGAQPVERSATFEATAPGQGRLSIMVGKETTAYRLTETACDVAGRNFRLNKSGADGGESYHVLIGDEVSTRCTCASFEHRSRCKHVDALRALIEHGVLPQLCPCCFVRFSDADGSACDVCMAEIQTEIEMLALDGRELIGFDPSDAA